MNQHLIIESPIIGSPKKVKTLKDKIRMECVLQTVGDVNRNKRIYDKKSLQESIDKIMPRVKNRSFLGELDHPVSSDPSRQTTVLFRESSHLIVEMGWDGNKLVGIVETLKTPNGEILRNLVEDEISVGFSFRGMGDLSPVFENGQQCYRVKGPLFTITWDSVSYPSHSEAVVQKITESYSQAIYESININNIIESEDGCIVCENGVCYLPNDFDKMVELRKQKLLSKFTR